MTISRQPQISWQTDLKYKNFFFIIPLPQFQKEIDQNKYYLFPECFNGVLYIATNNFRWKQIKKKITLWF